MTPKDPAAVNLGRRGGQARAANRTKEELSEIGRRGAQARWSQELEKIGKLAGEITTGTKALLKKTQQRERALARAKAKRKTDSKP